MESANRLLPDKTFNWKYSLRMAHEMDKKQKIYKTSNRNNNNNNKYIFQNVPLSHSNENKIYFLSYELLSLIAEKHFRSHSLGVYLLRRARGPAQGGTTQTTGGQGDIMGTRRTSTSPRASLQLHASIYHCLFTSG